MDREDHSGEWFSSCTSIGERLLSTAPTYVEIYLWIVCICSCTNIYIIKHTQHSLILFHLFRRNLHWLSSPASWPNLGNQKLNHVIKNIVQMLLHTSWLWASTTSLRCLFQSFKRNKKQWDNAKMHTFLNFYFILFF